eukprot:3787957-Rhodomonas_salina.3
MESTLDISRRLCPSGTELSHGSKLAYDFLLRAANTLFASGIVCFWNQGSGWVESKLSVVFGKDESLDVGGEALVKKLRGMGPLTVSTCYPRVLAATSKTDCLVKRLQVHSDDAGARTDAKKRHKLDIGDLTGDVCTRYPGTARNESHTCTPELMRYVQHHKSTACGAGVVSTTQHTALARSNSSVETVCEELVKAAVKAIT